MLYHVLESLRYLNSGERIPADTVSSLKRLSPKTIALLLAKGRIAEVIAPPLRALPGWGEKAAEYAEQGIEDVNDLVDAEDVPEKDVEEATKWVTPGYDSPGATPIVGEPLEVTPMDEFIPVYELDEVEDELDDEV